MVWKKSLLSSLMLLLAAGCTYSGNQFQMQGLDQIIIGQTTLDEASEQLGALPADVWIQGNSTLARWGWKGSVATDAVYIRQELWLRFGADGKFQRLENKINIPPNYRPRSAPEPAPAPQDQAAPQAGEQINHITVTPAGVSTQTLPVAPLAAPQAAEAAPAAARAPAKPAAKKPPAKSAPAPAPKPQPIQDPLLPAGKKVIPGVTYPLNSP